jgi:hypothetical protein
LTTFNLASGTGDREHLPAPARIEDVRALITTPAYSPLSNGLAEGFVHAFKRDYVNVHKLRDAGSVLAQHAAWIADYQPPGSISNSNCRRRGSSARVRVPNGIR